MNRNEIKEYLNNEFENKIYERYRRLYNKDYSEILNNIIETTSYLNPEVKITERLYHIYNDLYETPKCPNCGNIVSFNSLNKGYLNFCSIKCATNNSETRRKYEETCMKKYGCKNVFQAEAIKEKAKETCKEKFGVENVAYSQEFIEKRKNSLLSKNINKLSINKDKVIKEKTIKLKDNNIKYKNEILTFEYVKNNCKFKDEIIEFLNTLDLDIILDDMNILADVYIPSKNVAISFDDLYNHVESRGKDKKYHLFQTEDCLSKNIQLIHIFEDEWIFKSDIVKSRLKQILNLNDVPRIHARECEIKEIDPKTKNEFLNNYHIQGKDNSRIKLGAFYNDELISVMTFSNGSIAKGSKNLEDVYELNRFCSHPNYHIPGIASKLLTHFKRNYKWNEIFSYADRRWSDGNLYSKLGFELISITKPNYFYIKGYDRMHRFGFRKRPEEPKDITEYTLRLAEGYTRIWDSGHFKFGMVNIEYK